MKTFYFIPLMFLTACSTTPRLALRPQSPSPVTDKIRYPEVVRAYHFGRYVDPNDDFIMHEQHTVFRVEENDRWDLHPAAIGSSAVFPAVPLPCDAAFDPAPVNDAILAEVNSQRLATTQIMLEARVLSSALGQFQAALKQARTNLQETAVLRASVIEIKGRLDALETERELTPPPLPNSLTNEPTDSLSP